MAVASVMKYERIPFESLPDQPGRSGKSVVLNNFRSAQCPIVILIKSHPYLLCLLEFAAARLSVAEHAIAVADRAGTGLSDQAV